jgi:DNA replication protein DnaC
MAIGLAAAACQRGKKVRFFRVTELLTRLLEVLGNERLVGATLDRLTHRCHLLEATGESYRLREARRRRQAAGGGGAREEKQLKMPKHEKGREPLWASPAVY